MAVDGSQSLVNELCLQKDCSDVRIRFACMLFLKYRVYGLGVLGCQTNRDTGDFVDVDPFVPNRVREKWLQLQSRPLGDV